MKTIKKFTAPILAALTLTFSLTLSPYREYWVQPFVNINFFRILLFLCLIAIVSLLGRMMIPNYLGKSMIKFENHIMVKSLIENDTYIVYVVFTSTMIFEELIFRGFILVSLLELAHLSQESAVILNAIVFSLYHLHTWPTFRDKKITTVFLLVSALLGLICGYFLFSFGYIGVIIFHWLSVFLIYRNLVSMILEKKKK